MIKDYSIGYYKGSNSGKSTIIINDLVKLNDYVEPDIYSFVYSDGQTQTPFNLFVNQIKGSVNNIRQVKTADDGYYQRENIDGVWTEWVKVSYSVDGLTSSVPNKTYKKGAIVSFIVNGVQSNYVSKIDNNTTTPTTNPENWREINELLDRGEVQYMIDLTVVRSMRKEY